MIDVQIKSAYYDINKPVISNFEMHVNKGEIVSVIGRSGAGKTTLLKIIAGLHKDFDGNININDCFRLAFIPQNQGLLQWKTTYDNITLLSAKVSREHKKEQEQKAKTLIKKLGLEGFEKQYPNMLSGGQYKRVALGQAFFSEPDIILMDEPFSGLDGEMKKAVQDLFLQMRAEKGITTIFVTHDIQETEYMGSRTVEVGGV